MSRIAILTPDLVGPVKNGGVGTALYWLACHLAKYHQVTVFLALEESIPREEFEFWKDFYRSMGIELKDLPQSDDLVQGTKFGLRSYRALMALVHGNYDVAHFPDLGGLGHFSALARHQGIALHRTCVCVHLHGPTLWHRLGSGELLKDERDVELGFLERSSVEHADLVLSPSEYLANWTQEQGWNTRQAIKVIGHAPMLWQPQKNLHAAGPQSEMREISFIGRLETRKGLIEFIEALSPMATPRRIKFIGRDGQVLDTTGKNFIRSKLEKLQHEIEIISDWGHHDVLEYLNRHRPLVVLPSRMENSPCMVTECLQLEIPFLASHVGGTAELICADDHEVLFPFGIDNLARAIEGALAKPEGPLVARPSMLLKNAGDSWLEFHKDLEELGAYEHTSFNKDSKVGPESRSVTVCIATKGRPELLRQALESLVNQTYKNFEVIVAIDSEATPSERATVEVINSFQSLLRITSFFTGNVGPNRARNLAADRAQSEFLLFMDDDNLAEKFELETFLKAQRRTDADLLSCFFDRQQDFDCKLEMRHSRWIAIGPCIGLAPKYNVFGDTNFFVKSEKFAQSGGFSPEVRLGEDWELLWRMHDLGMNHLVIPLSLFRYRDHGGNRSLELIKDESKKFDVLRSAIKRWPDGIRDLAMVGAEGIGRSNSRLDGAEQVSHSPKETTLWRLWDVERSKVLATSELTLNSYAFGWVLHTKAGDPQMILPVPIASTSHLRVRASIYSSFIGSLQVFAEVDGAFNEKYMVQTGLSVGWNEISLEIKGDRFGSRMRLDFGESAGEFLLRDLEVSAVGEIEYDCKKRHIEISEIEELSPDSDLGFQFSRDEFEVVGAEFKLLGSSLEINSFTSDPQIIFLPLAIESQNAFTIFEIDLVADNQTNGDFFYRYEGQSEFPPEQRVSFSVEAKRQKLEVAIFHRGPVLQWRLDPGSHPGRYEIFGLRNKDQARRKECNRRDRLPKRPMPQGRDKLPYDNEAT